jgi:DNA-binding NarL/FixJ family response regulator
MQSQVIICDQQAIYAIGSAMLIDKHPSYLSPKIINDFKGINELIVSDTPLVLVIDSNMVDFANQHITNALIKLKKQTPIMVVLNDADHLLLYQFIEHGFSVIVSRAASRAEWLKGLEMAKQDKVFFSEEISCKVASLMENMDDLQLIEKITTLALYDKYILIRICQEAPSKQIAHELGHSKRTIEGHRTKMMQLFDVKNVAGLVKIACISKLYEHYLSNPGLYDVTLCAKTSSL